MNSQVTDSTAASEPGSGQPTWASTNGESPNQVPDQQDTPSAVRAPSLRGPPPSYDSSQTPTDPPFVAADYAHDNKQHLLLCASGSVATIKIPNICKALAGHDRLSIRIVLTQSSMRFLAGQSAEQPTVESLLQIPNVDAVYTDEDEWRHPWKRGGPVMHVELRRWASICVVAPLSANTLAKMVNGLSDNLLTSVLRAWDTEGGIENRGRNTSDGGLRKRVIVAPAMNTAMWLHPITDRQMKILTDEWGVGGKNRRGGAGWVEVLLPTTKELACGDVGLGAMIPWEEIVRVIRARLWLESPSPR